MDNGVDVFKVQKMLREHADRGLDLSHPQGVVVHGRLYPASHKELWINQFKNDSPSSFHAFAEVPLESGNLLSLSSWGDSSDPRILAKLQHPYTQHRESYAGEGYLSHGYEFLNEGDGPHPRIKRLDPDTAHQTIGELMKTPSWGLVTNVHDVVGKDEDRLMTPDDMRKHSQAISSTPFTAPSRGDVVRTNLQGEVFKDRYIDEVLKEPLPRGHVHVYRMGLMVPGGTSHYYSYDPSTESLKHHLSI